MLAQGHNAVTPVMIGFAAPRSRVKHSTTGLLRSPLSGLRSNSIPIRHFLQPKEVCEVANVSESIFEHEIMRERERERDANDNTKKKDFIGLEHHNRTTCNQI